MTSLDRSIVPSDPGANRVLVVDDDLSQRMMLVRILRKHEFESAVAMSTEEARAQLESLDFALVISDLRMFAEDGIELVRYISDHYPDTYSIVVSGFASEEDGDAVRRAGAYDLMTKPIDPDRFVGKVKEALAHRAQTVAERRHKTNW
jgi:DNA-binding NtrC family response regulator